MKNTILFLTNNENTHDLYQWLKDSGEHIILFSHKVTLDEVISINPYLIISFNYRFLIKSDIINYVNGNIINLHASLLPYNRGSSPNFFSFIDNTPKGVTIHMIDPGLDTGDILLQKELFFDIEKETFASTYNILLHELKNLLKENWQEIKKGALTPTPQSGIGTYHTMKQFDNITQQHPFEWSNNISEYINKINSQK